MCSHADVAAGGGALDGAVGAACTGTRMAVVGITKAGWTETATVFEGVLRGAGLEWCASFVNDCKYSRLGLLAGIGTDTEWPIWLTASFGRFGGGPDDGCSRRNMSFDSRACCD